MGACRVRGLGLIGSRVSFFILSAYALHDSTALLGGGGGLCRVMAKKMATTMLFRFRADMENHHPEWNTCLPKDEITTRSLLANSLCQGCRCLILVYQHIRDPSPIKQDIIPASALSVFFVVLFGSPSSGFQFTIFECFVFRS